MTKLENPQSSATPEIHAFLRQRVQDVYGGVLSRFAEACGVAPSMASKWIALEPKRQRTPSPASCRRIAETLGLDEDYVLALAGHRAGDAAPQRNLRLAAFLALVENAFHALSDQEWGVREDVGRALFSVPPTRVIGHSSAPVSGANGLAHRAPSRSEPAPDDDGDALASCKPDAGGPLILPAARALVAVAAAVYASG
jgi:transcriptional regulator with XRE-family HTH domain